MKLLVADDEVMSRYLTVKILNDAGFEVVSAAHGEEAWTILQAANPPRLVVLDWMMPVLDGIELCRRIRATQMAQYTYLLVLTARTYKCDIVAALNAGADDYLTKPYNRDELVARVQIGQRVLAREDKLTRISTAWRTMLDTIPLGVAGLGSDGTITRANRPFFELVGYGDMNQLLGRNIGANIIRDETDYQGLLDYIRSREPFDAANVRMYRRDGRPRMMNIWGRPLPTGTETVYEIMTSFLPANSRSLALDADSEEVQQIGPGLGCRLEVERRI